MGIDEEMWVGFARQWPLAVFLNLTYFDKFEKNQQEI
jgi:hypothetical protein